MLRLRLQRFGKKKRPYYRVVAADARAPRDGKFKELLGTYDPLHDPVIVDINMERVDYWVGVGAQPSETVAGLIRRVKEGKTVTRKEVHGQYRERRQQQREAALARKPLAAAPVASVQPAPAEASSVDETPSEA